MGSLKKITKINERRHKLPISEMREGKSAQIL